MRSYLFALQCILVSPRKKRSDVINPWYNLKGSLRCAFADDGAFTSHFGEVNLGRGKLWRLRGEVKKTKPTLPLLEYLIQEMRNLNWSSLEVGAILALLALVIFVRGCRLL